jgi:GxxExxY protein
MTYIILKEESYKIIGAAMEVHKELGSGFSEPVYQEALELEFQLQKMPYEREKLLNIFYKNHKLTKRYSSDFLCYDKIIVELKALHETSGDHEAQVLNYLKASQLKLGLLINFGTKSLQYKRLIL